MTREMRITLMKALNVVTVAIPFALVWFLFYAVRLPDPMAASMRCVIMLVYFALYFFFCRTYDALLISYLRIRDMAVNQTLSVLLTDAFMFFILWSMNHSFPVLWPALLCLVAQVGIAVLWCKLSHGWYYRRFPAKNTLIVYDTRDDVEKLIQQYDLDKKFDVKKVLHIDECMRDLSCLGGIATIIFSGIHSHERNILVKLCLRKNISSIIIPRLGDSIMSSAKPLHILHLPVMRVDRFSPRPVYSILKRGFDIFFSSIALILFGLPMIVLSVLIRKDGGPAFYKQTRLTKDGKEFKLIKFRSMRVDAEKDGVARLSTGENDDRITPIGKKIRACRLDELPQFINILKGEMSFVGPRPERPEIAEQYEQEMPEFALRLQCKAGLTGYAQVYGKYNTTPYDKLNMDLMYIAQASVMNDFRLLLATIGILFSKESTEGVEVGQTTAMGYENSADSTGKDTDTVKNRAD